MKTKKIDFNPETHSYFVDGARVPSVTQILGEFFPFKGQGEAAERARNFGNAVHKAIELDLNNQLDYVTVHESIIPYLNQFNEAIKKLRYQRLSSPELRLYSKKHKFCGTIDFPGNVIVDIKTGGKSPAHRLQIAAYRHLWNNNNPMDKIGKGAVLYLDGSEKTIIEPEQPQDFKTFLDCLNIYNWKRKERLNGTPKDLE